MVIPKMFTSTKKSLKALGLPGDGLIYKSEKAIQISVHNHFREKHVSDYLPHLKFVLYNQYYSSEDRLVCLKDFLTGGIRGVVPFPKISTLFI